jgi:hypothetical protein
MDDHSRRNRPDDSRGGQKATLMVAVAVLLLLLLYAYEHLWR